MNNKKTTKGRINSAIIYKLLLDNASELHPLKIASSKKDEVTIQSLLVDEGVIIDPHTVSENLYAMQEMGLVDTVKSDYAKVRGRWYAVREYLDSDSTLILLMSLYSNMNLGRNQIDALRDSLKPLIGEPSIERLNAAFPKAKPYWNKNIPSYIYTIDEAINHNKQVEYISGIYDYSNKKMVNNPTKNKARRVNPLAVTNYRGSLYMLYYDEHHQDVAFIRLDSISSLEECSIPRRVPDDFVVEDYLEHRAYPSRGDIMEFEVIVNDQGDRGSPKANLSYVLQYFGEDVTIFEKPDGLHVIFATNMYSFKYWYIQYADNFTIVSPLSAKDQVRDYINNISSKL